MILPAVHQLQRRVFADLDETRHGVGWWAPHPGTSRQILIRDHLVQCITSVEVNLVDARLHLQWRDRCADVGACRAPHPLGVALSGRRIVEVPRRHVLGQPRAVAGEVEGEPVFVHFVGAHGQDDRSALSSRGNDQRRPFVDR